MLESVIFSVATFAVVIHIAVFVAATLAVLALATVITIVINACSRYHTVANIKPAVIAAIAVLSTKLQKLAQNSILALPIHTVLSLATVISIVVAD